MEQPRESSEKDVVMDVKARKGSRRRASRKQKGLANEIVEEPAGTVVTKDPAVNTTMVPVAGPGVVAKTKTLQQEGGSPKVVLAPAKQKTAKVMLVPKGQRPRLQLPKKTFKAKRVAVTIDNTVKTHKRRKAVMAQIDAMTEDQVRGAAVAARLSRRETVAKAPIGLLRQMVKDYRSLRGLL